MGKSLETIRKDCARAILSLHQRANSGHIGSSLSCLEILIDLCFRRMAPEDVLVLSKGHAASALYVTLAKSGRLAEKELETFYADGTRLAAHPPCTREIPSIPFGTGSLGHGLSLAAGIAFSQRYTGKRFQIYCVLSDGDCNEGSTWEGALFASHHGLSNLTVIVDRNGIQGFGRSSDVLELEPLAEKWRAFGFETQVAGDGNDFGELDAAHGNLQQSGRPRCLLAKTVKGHGVSYMENTVEWHYWPMTEAQFKIAMAELEAEE